jgi:hypothetical protein
MEITLPSSFLGLDLPKSKMRSAPGRVQVSIRRVSSTMNERGGGAPGELADRGVKEQKNTRESSSFQSATRAVIS